MLTVQRMLAQTTLPLTALVESYNRNQIIQSVTVMESTAVSTWLQGGEFILVSEQTLWHKIDNIVELLQRLIDFRCGGLAVKKTTQVELPEEVLQFASDHRFPIFQFPADVTYLEIMTPINEQLFMRKQSEFLKKNMAKYLLQTNNPSLNNFSIPDSVADEETMVCVLKTMFDDGWLNQARQQLQFMQVIAKSNLQINERLESLKSQKKILDYILLEEINEITIVIFYRWEETQSSEAIIDFFRKADTLSNSFQMNWGISNGYNIRDAKRANDEAAFALKMRKILPVGEPFLFYHQVEFYQLVEEMAQSSTTHNFFDFTKTLADYPDLLKTLELFFRQNEQLKSTSETMFIHINTLRYRLERIKTITGLDYTKTSDKLKLYLGVIHLNNLQNRSTSHG